MTKQLSKSKYLAGLQCQKRLWLEIYDPDKASPPSRAQQRTFDQATAVGILAQTRFPTGVRIEVDPNDLDKYVAETTAAIEKGATVIFEATFLYDQTYILVDIITKNDDDTWDLYAVKASTGVKTTHLQDLAVQRYVMEGTGYPVAKVYVMHIDYRYRYDGAEVDLSGLFAVDEVSQVVADEMIAVPANLQLFQSRLQQATPPHVLIGPCCTHPCPCSFKAYCWESYSRQTGFNIPNLPGKKKARLPEQGIGLLEQLSDDFQLSVVQQAYVGRIGSRQINIDAEAIQDKLAELEFPLYFLDFQTDNPAIPRFAGTRPYQQIPFQYSCHLMQADGTIEHHDYLHPYYSDPRLPLVESLVAVIGDKGSVGAYNVAFERAVLQDLAATFPDYAGLLGSIVARLWDQRLIFKNHSAPNGFGNSNSINYVLPRLVPGLTYETLPIQNGADAQADWHRMLATDDPALKAQLARELRAYCELNTLAMVEIHRAAAKRSFAGWLRMTQSMSR